MTKRLSLGGRLRMAAACPDANAPLLAEAADAIEAHDAFRREVSDAIGAYFRLDNYLGKFSDTLGRFIITNPKPDPLVEAMTAAFGEGYEQLEADNLRAMLEARGLEIREKGAGSPLFYPNLT